MFIKIDGSYVNLALVHSIDLNDDGDDGPHFYGPGGTAI